MSYLSVKADRRDLIDAHFDACKKSQQPYVLCRRRRTKADVEFDFISFDKSLDRIFEQREREIMDRAMEIFHRHKTKGATYHISAKVMAMRGLTVESAELAAAELYKLISGLIAEET
ncbi:hypothetical protein [Pseudogemmobacter blasticus]|uniref:Uncharacterized protein n=1 Tax=Fuscovulum blasticum DSM 2131 TaxID=1188250 RepID=A0A2T4JDI7_FUSBL|nr:hypothetical protein [Fuscovulum blasticum]PTE15969.1 hypothetical protein C5F44_02715 [Fuscovulum blasticum DSM 2131]